MISNDDVLPSFIFIWSSCDDNNDNDDNDDGDDDNDDDGDDDKDTDDIIFSPGEFDYQLFRTLLARYAR